MQLVMSFLIGVVFVINYSSQSFAADKKTKTEPKRNVAQEVSKPQGPFKGKCIPLGETKLQLFDDETYQYLYDLEEMRMLRNSIFAQYGYPFKDQAIIAEMKRRQCTQKDSGLDYNKMSALDTNNVRLLKSHEEYFSSDLRKNDFDKQWKVESKEGHFEMVKGHYCYLTQKGDQKLKGVIYFNSKKQKGSTYKLEAMMNTDKPDWAVIPGSDSIAKEYKEKLNSKDFDMTDLGSTFEYNHSGSWTIEADKLVHIKLPDDKIDNATVQVSGEHFKDKEVLFCTYELTKK